MQQCFCRLVTEKYQISEKRDLTLKPKKIREIATDKIENMENNSPTVKFLDYARNIEKKVSKNIFYSFEY